MQIFHYVAAVLKSTPLFESGDPDIREKDGAYYNDYEGNSIDLLQEVDEISEFGETSNGNQGNIMPLTDVVPKKAVAHAILEADRNEGILYDHVTFDSPFFDCTTDPADDGYIEKVYNLLSNHGWQDIPGTSKTNDVFEMRRITEWKGPDTVYDAYLLSNNQSRNWFPKEIFMEKYPNWEEEREVLFEVHNEEQPAEPQPADTQPTEVEVSVVEVERPDDHIVTQFFQGEL